MSEVDNKLKLIVEGLIMASGKPLTLDGIARVFDAEERPDKDEIRAALLEISADCCERGFELKEVGSGFRFQVKQELSTWVARLWDEKPQKYTRALLETLALIAYRQPITRGDIEEIRGVGVSTTIMRTLLDRDWIRVVGHRDVPGRPAMYATARHFLDYFNLKSLQDLPPLSEIQDLDNVNQQLDLDEEMKDIRVLDLPEEDATAEHTIDGEQTEEDQIAEDEAAALSTRPLDEILGLVKEDEEQVEDEILQETTAQRTIDQEAIDRQTPTQAGEETDAEVAEQTGADVEASGDDQLQDRHTEQEDSESDDFDGESDSSFSQQPI